MSKKPLFILGIVILILVIGGMFLLNKGGGDTLVDFEEQQQAAEPASPKTEVRAKGFNAEVLVKPSVDNVISGVVTISVTKAPAETNMAFFTITGQGVEGIGPAGPNLGIDGDATDGWSKLIDTTKYKNGLYEIAGLAMPSTDDDPLGMATVQVLIQN